MQDAGLKIGTRGSPLALAQAHQVRDLLIRAHGLNERDFEIHVIKTTGDKIQDRPLSEAGGKGLFTKEIEEALLDNTIDIAVHSMKDMATELPPGLRIGAMLPREDVRDAFISPRHASLADMPAGAVVGTSSLRRQAQVMHMRPDLKVVGFRGNVQTRLQKLADGVADATFLACAGLNRLGLQDRITRAVETDEMLPACAQGAIGIELRGEDERSACMISKLNDEATSLCVTMERAFLNKLEGSCRTPIGGLARLNEGKITFGGEILSPDGARRFATSREGEPQAAVALGEDAAAQLLDEAGPDFFVLSS